MKIQEMIEAIKNGKKVRRECWSGSRGDEGSSWWEVNRVSEFYKSKED